MTSDTSLNSKRPAVDLRHRNGESHTNPPESSAAANEVISASGRLRIDPPDDSGMISGGKTAKPGTAIHSLETEASLERFVFQHGQYFDSYLATEPDRMLFWSRNRQGLVSYTRRGSHVLVGGGLIAPDAEKPRLLREFLEFAKLNRWRLAFHNISVDEAPLFRALDFQITKWGAEPVIDLTSCTWEGKAFEWVRRQTNYCKRHGVVAYEVRQDELEPQQWMRTLAEINEVAEESLSVKAQAAEMRFFEGRIHDHELGLRRLFLARSGHGAGRLEGFVVCNPMLGGQMWSTELYRHRLDAVRGTVAFLFHQLMQKMQQEGVRKVGLCLDPGFGVETAMPGDSALIRNGFRFGEKYLGAVFDVAGLRHFKTRFRPQFEDRLTCVWPRVTIGSVLAFLQVSGTFNVSLVKATKIAVRRMWKRWQGSANVE